ncbi:MAG: hypothetical protein ACRENX_11360 [Candidatus Dormibacteria bacterium]
MTELRLRDWGLSDLEPDADGDWIGLAQDLPHSSDVQVRIRAGLPWTDAVRMLHKLARWVEESR